MRTGLLLGVLVLMFAGMAFYLSWAPWWGRELLFALGGILVTRDLIRWWGRRAHE
jgi:hypothetical protein